MQERIKKSSENAQYRPQYLFELTKNYCELMLYRYSRGDAITELVQYFPPMLDAWEESNRLHLEFRTEAELWERRDWRHNLDHYIVCFWLVGLALTLDIPEVIWQRLLVLIGNDGHDILLDRVIATRSPERTIGTNLCHAKPYARLLKAITAPEVQQPGLLKDFVEHWYVELDRPSTKKQHAVYNRPYWYTYGNENFEGGAYFGRWCVEAAVAAKVFGIDDSLCLGMEHYPGDLLRPDGPSTHRPRPDKPTGFLARLFGR
ncbi:conserved hypothetical protein [Janthinobacterium agaricidamnosum NBRC 102515 = DSM 9628]|uniref:Uncharacterized protein n=2 Tax=Janthinobacterium agaricidamnosum TaxID=55508 RepID=W0V6M5_9BURK|nr:conserved hypothetical protein [Janthinobacterium agaricidamnosum NBRC 102515 = DSM 9628]